jgi:hypothetical protein
VILGTEINVRFMSFLFLAMKTPFFIFWLSKRFFCVKQLKEKQPAIVGHLYTKMDDHLYIIFYINADDTGFSIVPWRFRWKWVRYKLRAANSIFYGKNHF